MASKQQAGSAETVDGHNQMQGSADTSIQNPAVKNAAVSGQKPVPKRIDPGLQVLYG